MADLKRVGLFIAAGDAYGRGLMRGIAQYSRTHGPWALSIQLHGYRPRLGWIRDWDPDGFLLQTHHAEVVDAAIEKGVPAVNVSASAPDGRLPRVISDGHAIGRVGADHFKARGFERFAFCGYQGLGMSAGRQQGFEARIRELGCTVESYAEPHVPGTDWTLEKEQESLVAWLGSLQKPVALMACNDVRAFDVLEACRRADLQVPEDVAVLGVDNDPVMCELALPPLSSVVQPLEKIGYEAAAMLARLWKGKAAPKKPVTFAPMGVIARPSTDVMAVEDEAVVEALRYIREHAGHPIDVPDVVTAAGVSRRSLERRFREKLQRSPRDEIRRVHLERARQILVETDLPMPAVAERSGFRRAQILSQIFKRETGMTPTDFRMQNRVC